MTQQLEKRPCKIGNINPRPEIHGEEKVPAIDVSLSGIMLTKAELGELLGNKFAWDGLFNEKGALAEPANKCFKPIGLDLKFESANASLYVGIKLELIELSDCKLTSLKIAPQVGGLTELKLTVQATPDMDSVAAPLLNWMGRDADVELDFGDVAAEEAKEKQGDLALNSHGNNEAPAAKPKRRGRKPQDGATIN